jgi:hypothetical protein
VPAGTYNSLSLTFANPQLVIINHSDSALSSSCAVGSICTLTPALDNSATVDFGSAPFPVTVSANSPLGFLVDFHLNTVIQSDLSVNLGVANGITLAQLPAAVSPVAPPFGFLTGAVGTVSISQNQFTLVAPWGKTFTVDVNSSTVFADWPPCASPGTLSCLSSGAIVQVQVASVESNGDLLAAKIVFLKLQSQSPQVVEGTVIGFGPMQIKLILHNQFPNSTAVPLGGVATVTIDSGATFSVDSGGFAIPSGAVFSGFSNLTFGQELQLAVDPGSMSCVTNWVLTGSWQAPPSCTFSTNNVQLEPSQLSGIVSSIDSSASSFALGNFPSITFGPGAPVALSIPVDTASQTIYQGFATDSFSGLADGDFVSVNGWVFEDDNGILDPAMTQPFVLAQTVTQHSAGIF